MSVFTDATNVKFFTEGLWCDEAFSWALASKGSALLPLTSTRFQPASLLSDPSRLDGSSRHIRDGDALALGAVLRPDPRHRLALHGRCRQNRATAGRCVPGLFAVNPMLTYYAVEARMYSMVACLAAASMYTFALRRRGWYVAVTTVALYTHYFVVLLLIAQAASVLLTEAGEERRRRFAQVCLPVALLLPWISYVVAVRQSWESNFWILPPGKRFVVHLSSICDEPTFRLLRHHESGFSPWC